MKIKLCKNCVNPITRPNIEFNKEGLCPVCQFETSRQELKIDWQQRQSELDAICDWGRKNTKSAYDCIVTVSGGKDSLRQACYARDELGMNPLLVNCSYPPEQVTDRGAYNLQNLINLGFDTLSISPNPIIWKTLMKHGFMHFGNWGRSTEMALYAIPVHVAVAYKIPLLFYGENPVHTIGEKHGKADGDASQLKKGNTIAGGPDSLGEIPVLPKDIFFYYYPSDKDMHAANLRLTYLGYYIPDWSGRNNATFSIERGLQVRTDEPPEMIGDLWGFSCLDEDFTIINQYFKYLKLGFGRVNDQVCEAINAGIMTRAEGLTLLNKYDGKCDSTYIERFCHYLGISRNKFNAVVERYRNKELWKKDSLGQWQVEYEGVT